MTEDLIVPDWRALKKDMASMSNVQSWVGSFVIKDIIGSVVKLQWSLWIKGVWEFFVFLYDFFMRLKLFPCTKEKKKERKSYIIIIILYSSCSQQWNHCCFSSDTGVIYQSMIWKYVCLLSYRGIRKIETDPCLRQQNLILYILEDTTRDLLCVAVSSNDQ